MSPFDLTRDYFFSGILVEEAVIGTASNGQGSEVVSFSRDVNGAANTLSYNNAAQSFTVAYQGASATYGPADFIGAFPDGRSYAKTGLLSELSANINIRIAVNYVAAGQWRIAGQTSTGRNVSYYRTFVYGEPSRSADVVLTGTTTFTTALFTNTIDNRGLFNAAFQSGDLTWSRSSGRITGSITLTSPETVKLDIAGDVTNPGSRVSLAITDPAGRYRGTAVLRFYGPNGINLGAVVEITRPDGEIISGVLLGNSF